MCNELKNEIDKSFNMSNDKDNLNVADLTTILNDEDRAGLVHALKTKLQSLNGQHSELLKNLSSIVRKCVEDLRGIQSQHDELEAKFLEVRTALETKYQKLYQPLYIKRYEIVNGVGDIETTNEAGMDQKGEKDATEKGVSVFWLVAMKNNEVLAEEITKRDEGALTSSTESHRCPTRYKRSEEEKTTKGTGQGSVHEATIMSHPQASNIFKASIVVERLESQAEIWRKDE
ncbi:nucleosome assembly protein [Salix suchowensis]|nr:nucleosome assembly protein [Salix suchowensis]